MVTFPSVFKKTFFKHLLFWIVVYLFYVTSRKKGFETSQELFVTFIFHVSLQAITAYSVLLFLVPRYRKTRNILELMILCFLILFGINMIFVAAKMTFFESTYPCCYGEEAIKYGHLNYFERIFHIKSFLINDAFFYLQPLFFLVALQFYEKQQKLSEINEQKKIAELKVLKHQLNPHFLFNTLNNLYSLSIEKSDRAPEVIKKLSDILDYMLYGCDEKYVPLEREIYLIENYLVLEQIRYEDSVLISFINTVDRSVKIAPLILLTFIENAFKHGVSQELNVATVSISLALDNKNIIFKISNTKALTDINKSSNEKQIGLSNIEKQLKLLYPNKYSLTIEDDRKSYNVVLNLQQF